MPFIITGLVILHIVALHTDGSNNPIGHNSNVDKLSFHPRCTHSCHVIMAGPCTSQQMISVSGPDMRAMFDV